MSEIKLYRYEDVVYANISISVDGYESYYPSEPKVELREYTVLKETPQGFWISFWGRNLFGSDKKWVSKNSLKRFAYPDKTEALCSFMHRKSRQIKIYEARLNRARKAMKTAEQMLEVAEVVENKNQEI